MTLPPHEAVQLPLHDAHLLNFEFVPNERGSITAIINIIINAEEFFLKRFGLKNGKFNLVFENCWQIKNDLIGYATGSETISAFDLIEQSDLKQKLASYGFGHTKISHFRISGSHGSQLDMLAEIFSIKSIN